MVLVMFPRTPVRETQQYDESKAHTGLMVALALSDALTTSIDLAMRGVELPADARALSGSDLHITLGYVPYLGWSALNNDPADLSGFLTSLLQDDFGRLVAPLPIRISGIGRFPGSPSSDNMDVLIAKIDSESVVSFHDVLVDSLGDDADLQFSTLHTYTPHITLAYVPADYPTPMVRLPKAEVDLSRLMLKIGDLPASYVELKGSNKFTEDDEPKKFYNPHHDAHGEFARSSGGGTATMDPRERAEADNAAMAMHYLKEKADQSVGSGGGITRPVDARDPAAYGHRASEIRAARTSAAGMADEGVLRSAFEGKFGELTTKIDKISIDGDRWSARGTIHDADGHSVGMFWRSGGHDLKDGYGHVLAAGSYASHNHLSLHEDVQGKGFASEFNRNAENHYIANGVKTISIDANIDVGGYAWARQGYDFPSPASKAKFVKDRTDELRYDMDDFNAEQQPHQQRLRDIVGKDYVDVTAKAVLAQHSWDIAAIRHNGQPLGKELMLESQWYGMKSLEPNSPGLVVGEVAYQRRHR